MSQWDGKSKGTLLGYQIFVTIIRKMGVGAAYILLVPVSFYYVVVYPDTFRAMYRYFRHRQEFSFFKTLISICKSYFVFGQVIIDKVAIFAGLRNKFTFDFDGIDILKEMLSEGKGGVLISAHIGNFEIAEKFFADIDFNHQIHIVSVDQEHSVIKEYLEQVASEKHSVNFIHIREDMSHVFEISAALAKNHLICLTGDRYIAQSKTMSSTLLGKQALFPAGTFMIASRLNAPVAFVYVMKEPHLHYHLYTRRANTFKHRDAQSILNDYTQSLEAMLKKYPYQWFNYFDFWKH